MKSDLIFVFPLHSIDSQNLDTCRMQRVVRSIEIDQELIKHDVDLKLLKHNTDIKEAPFQEQHAIGLWERLIKNLIDTWHV